jgi:hypothetical protein
MAGFSDDELLDFARQCINGNISAYDFARMIAEAKDRTVTTVIFGDCPNESEARALLKEAENAAWRRPR